MDEFELGPIDAGEVLTLQRAAFASEAQLYGDPFLPALTQTLEELEQELLGPGLGMRIDGRLVGAVRWTIHEPSWHRSTGHGAIVHRPSVHGSTMHGSTAHIRRLTVAPDMQGRGIGTQLLRSAQLASGAIHFEIFTGHLSDGNIRLYEREGFTLTRNEELLSGVTLVLMTK